MYTIKVNGSNYSHSILNGEDFLLEIFRLHGHSGNYRITTIEIHNEDNQTLFFNKRMAVNYLVNLLSWIHEKHICITQDPSLLEDTKTFISKIQDHICDVERKNFNIDPESFLHTYIYENIYAKRVSDYQPKLFQNEIASLIFYYYANDFWYRFYFAVNSVQCIRVLKKEERDFRVISNNLFNFIKYGNNLFYL